MYSLWIKPLVPWFQGVCLEGMLLCLKIMVDSVIVNLFFILLHCFICLHHAGHLSLGIVRWTFKVLPLVLFPWFKIHSCSSQHHIFCQQLCKSWLLFSAIFRLAMARPVGQSPKPYGMQFLHLQQHLGCYCRTPISATDVFAPYEIPSTCNTLPYLLLCCCKSPQPLKQIYTVLGVLY